MRARLSATAAGLAGLILASQGCPSGETSPMTTSSATSEGGKGGAGGMTPSRPDPVINENMSHAAPIVDDAHAGKVVTQLRTTPMLPDLDARSLAVVGDAVYAGTASGLARVKGGETAFSTVAVTGTGAVVDLAVDGAGQLLVARQDGVEVLTAQGGAGEVWPVAGEKVAAVIAGSTDVYVGTDLGLSRVDAVAQTPIAAAQGFPIRDLAAAGGVVWMATADGIKRYDVAGDELLPDLTAPTFLADDDVRALTLSADGKEMLAATAGGLARIQVSGASANIVVPGLAGLPNGDLRAVAEAGGEILTGHGIGATVTAATGKEHYHSRRYIPDEAVTAVAVGPDRSRWMATKAGVSRVSFQDTKLSDRAALFEPLVQPLFRMDGFVSDNGNYADPWDLTTKPSLSDHDNDGLWTEMQIAAWCFAYAATGDEAHYQNARKAMDTIFLLIDIPGETFAAKGMNRGFIARSLVRDDEGAVYDDKVNNDRWVKQDHAGHTYYWKNDTSSDEYAGHFFGIPVFYDLCARTEDEKQAIRDRVQLAMSYVIDGGDRLIDLDGEPTTFGRWDGLAVAADGIGPCLASGKPECASSFGGGGWLNSIEILGHLLAAWHITGDPRFYDEYDRLAIEERYAEMIPVTDHTYTVTSRHQANHSDHELASLGYYTLLRYEPNPERREIWKKSLRDFFAYEKTERNPFEIAVVASAMDGADLEGAARTLREMPSDWREWLVDNGHRVDATLDVPDRFDQPQFDTVFPYDEIRTMKWNGNPYAVSSGGNGKSLQGPWPWLLPYWMLRRHGAIVAP